jgi:hypothetical protein
MGGPIFCGTLFSWSLENNLAAPFDYHFCFFLLAAILILIFLVSLLMPLDIVSRAIDEEVVFLETESAECRD